MLRIEASLTVELDGQPCLEVRTEPDRLVLSFVSAPAFRRALRVFRQTPALPKVSLPARLRDALESQRVLLRVGQEEVAEIVPGEPTSLAARLAGLRIPGLRLRGGSLVRLLLGGE